MNEILIIEDDIELGSLTGDFLRNAGYSVTICTESLKGLDALKKHHYSIILLDVVLPDMNGFETCTAIRAVRDIPILMMSALNDEESKLTGYGVGADDYIDKPFSVNILIAKIKALLKRSGNDNHEIISECGITIDHHARTASKNGMILKLNAKEYDLLYVLMKNKGKAMSKEQLFNAVWGVDCFTEPSTVSVHIRWLREKLEDDPNSPMLIQTVYKIGYRFGAST